MNTEISYSGLIIWKLWNVYLKKVINKNMFFLIVLNFYKLLYLACLSTFVTFLGKNYKYFISNSVFNQRFISYGFLL